MANRDKASVRKRNKRKLIVFFVEVILLLVLLLVLWFAIKLSKINSEKTEAARHNDLDNNTLEVMGKYTTIALLGLDNRTSGSYTSGNADSIIIASIDNETKDVKLVSVYRDTYLEVTEEGKYFKVNSAYARNGGALGMVETLNRNLDLDIQKYVTVDWKALARTIDLLGGIEVELTAKEAQQVNKYTHKDTIKMTGYGSDQEAVEGVNNLDGVHAVAYARIRKGVGDDFKRTQRQREVITKMLSKLKKCGFSAINNIMDEVFPMISTNFSKTELLSLVAGVMDYDIVDTKGFPEDNDGKTMGKAGSCIIPISLLTNVIKLHEFLYADEKYTPSPTVQQISNQIIYDSGLAPQTEQ
ncbi:MAG: LCP family protein [Lachnospiraceae bacterium]|nr:LCP family protein [Lachnospiraceae bacterium]